MGAYPKGDIFKGEREVLTPEQIIAIGKAYEELIRNPGWKMLCEWVEKQIALQKERLVDIRQVKSIEEVNDIRILIMAYKWIAGKPKECIDKKNKTEEEIKKRRDK
jgi:hypothetical protein